MTYFKLPNSTKIPMMHFDVQALLSNNWEIHWALDLVYIIIFLYVSITFYCSVKGFSLVTFSFLSLGPTLVVDGMACLRSWYSCEDWVCGGQWKEYISKLACWVKAFTSTGIRLVFFFDGVVDEQKRPEWVRKGPPSLNQSFCPKSPFSSPDNI